MMDFFRESKYVQHPGFSIGGGNLWTAQECQAPHVFSNGICSIPGATEAQAKEACDKTVGCVGFDYTPQASYLKKANTGLTPFTGVTANTREEGVRWWLVILLVLLAVLIVGAIIVAVIRNRATLAVLNSGRDTSSPLILSA